VDRHKQQFQGPVVGPIGAHVKIAPGKENFAQIAEKAMGGSTALDRFIVTTDHDRKIFQKIRKEAGCQQDCGVYQCKPSRRYNVPAPPVDGIDTVASALNVSDDLVFNCLVDNLRIEEKGLSRSKQESEDLLLAYSNGRHSIRGKIKQVYFLPSGDFWQVKEGQMSMVGNDKTMRQTIGVDKSAALAESKRDLEGFQNDLRGLKQEEAKMEHQHTEHQKAWNVKKRASQGNVKDMERLSANIENIKLESDSAANFDTDTSEQEQDVSDAQQSLDALKEQEAELKEEIEDKKPVITDIKARLNEVKIRNEKVCMAVVRVLAF
jgi:chromosome segregation ATPase